MKKLLTLLFAAFSVFAQAQPYHYQAQIVTISWNRWEHLEMPTNDNDWFITDDTEVYNSGLVLESWRVDYGAAHKRFYGWREYYTLDLWYDMSLSIPLKRRIERQDGVTVYDASPSHYVFASMDVANEVSAFSSVDAWQNKYSRATQHNVGIQMNGLRSLRYRVRVGVTSIESVSDRSFRSGDIAGETIDFGRVEIAGQRCDSGGGVTIEIPGGGVVTDVTPHVSGEQYYRWGNFFVGQPVMIRPRH